jgi:hypothetical protein
MTDRTASARNARARARRKAEGLKLLRVWVPVDHEAQIKAMVAAYLEALTPRQ